MFLVPWPLRSRLGLVGGILACLLCHALPSLASAPATRPGLSATEIVTNKCWIFTHLQKSGGTTVKKILALKWGLKFKIYDSSQWKEGDAFSHRFGKILATGNEWNVIAGGYPEALRRTTVVENNCRWFTMFRHPVSRLVSAFFYCRSHPGDQLCARKEINVRNMDLVTFAKHWGNYALRQFALSIVPADAVIDHLVSKTGRDVEEYYIKATPGWYLLKLYLEDQAEASKYGEIPDAALYDMLPLAQDLLRDSYAAVGILEEFNTTLSLFDAALEIPGMDWQAEFQSGGKKRSVDAADVAEEADTLAEAWTNSDIKRFMHLDLQLYEHAVHVFNQQKKLYDLE